MAESPYTEALAGAINSSMAIATVHRNEFITPEHLLLAIASQEEFQHVFYLYEKDIRPFIASIRQYIHDMEQYPEGSNVTPEFSYLFNDMMKNAIMQATFAGISAIDVPHVFSAMMQVKDCYAGSLIKKQFGERLAEFLADLVSAYEEFDDEPFDDDFDDDTEPEGWRELVTDISDNLDKHNPLIGRERELNRTIEVLCRKDKNNPLHVGEPGVGKTALIYGLAALIKKGEVPERLRGCRIYQMELGTMIAGTQYRGDFEKRIKQVMDGLAEEGNAILYIDEIHNLIGAGRGTDSAMDASNMLKPYLESGNIRFIGSTTYDEYNRYFARSKGIVRRFQQIDVPEPTPEEAVAILKGLKKGYEQFHKVKYAPRVIEFAVEQSVKHIANRFLPDKAIDLIDEAGAYREAHPDYQAFTQKVDKQLIKEVLAKVCKVDAEALKDDDNTRLEELAPQMLSQIYGQDEAVKQVVEAVQMAKAGLLDDNKPLASLLFVGPTGVGKTEVARVLAHELGVSLVRFDMSEYAEKHAVAKLIGSPAGYVGYEDGGLLTDAIRKSPNCVLLLDEIEKAHSDIYNILLQVMDYAVLTDNRGQKADFRNVILIMTSNAGAQYASQANIGFTGNTTRGEAMLQQVKKTFQPEFINRLSNIVVFHDMNRDMASRILDKKLNLLQEKLTARKVTLRLDDDAREWLLAKGFTPKYGAREIDRVIAKHLKPLLMRQILFGKLKKGGDAKINKKMLEGQSS